MNANVKSNVFKGLSLFTAGILLAGTTVFAQAQPQQQWPKHVSGKVVAVSYEKVQTSPNVWADQIKVKVDSCQQKGKLEEVVYTPSMVSDRTALGHLFEENLHSATTMTMETPTPNYNGYGLFWLDESVKDYNKVIRTGILGHGINCNQIPQYLGQFK